jgi:hypothetical protein
MKILVLVMPIVLFIFNGVILNHKKKDTNSNIEKSLFINNIEIKDSKIKIYNNSIVDSSFINLYDFDKYDDQIYFGMTMSDWNRMISKSTRNGKFDVVEDNGDFKTYIGIKKVTGEDGFKKTLSGTFIKPIILNGNKKTFIKKNNKVLNFMLLSGFTLDFEFNSASYFNSYLNKYITDHNLKFVSGDSPAYPKGKDSKNLLPSLIFILNSLGDPNLNIKKEEKYSEGRTSTLYENKNYYVSISRRYRRTETTTKNGSQVLPEHCFVDYNFYMYINVKSKKLNQIDINSYNSPEQKKNSEIKTNTERLIDKY